MKINKNAIVARWNKLTDENEHGEALLFLARATSQEYYAGALVLLNGLHRRIGELPPDLLAFRNRIQEPIFKKAIEVLGADVVEKLK